MPCKQETPANRRFDDGREPPRTPGYSDGLPAIGHRKALCAQSPTSRRPSVADACRALFTASPTARRAADQLPHTAVTTLADGQQPWFKRRSASPPRRRACVRDQSYEDGSLPYRRRQSSMASTTRSRFHRRSIAPGWQALQYGYASPLPLFCSRLGYVAGSWTWPVAVAGLRVGAAAAAHPLVASLDRPRLLPGRIVEVRLHGRGRAAETVGDIPDRQALELAVVACKRHGASAFGNAVESGRS